jgi:DNA processing protein
MQILNINTITYNEELYPKKLKLLEDAPYTLFYKGNIEKLNEHKNVSIIGSRKCTRYGIDVTSAIVKELSNYDVNVISGMARGIDTAAHKAAISNSGYTCAVLGCGIDIIYPKENKYIYNEIQNRGCVISEFIPGTPPYAYNFPIRNRIISVLSDLVIVVEADIKSGSLITANLALEQGKDVMAVPGSLFSAQSKGTNKLIKDGAYPLTDVEDIFNLIGIDFNQCESINYRSELSINQKIFSVLSDSPMHIDDIIRRTNIDIKQLYGLLFEFQLKEEILCLSGNYYVRINNKI